MMKMMKWEKLLVLTVNKVIVKVMTVETAIVKMMTVEKVTVKIMIVKTEMMIGE